MPALACAPMKAFRFVMTLLSAPKACDLCARCWCVHGEGANGLCWHKYTDMLSFGESIRHRYLSDATKKSSFLSTRKKRMGWSRDASEYQWDAMRATIVILVFACVLKSLPQGSAGQNDRISRTLVANGERYHSLAQQDQLPSIRLQHAAMAVANLQAARQLFSDGSIERSTGVDVHALTKKTDAFLNRCLNLSKSKQGRKTLPTWS